ncbi:MAG: 50S ribosomal protein L13 [Nitrospirota bacterium]
MRTISYKREDCEKRWYLIDADGKILGRLASEVASILRGKNKPIFTPHADMGDFVIIINAEKIRLTGKKITQKMYYYHTGYPGGIKSSTAKEKIEKKPTDVIMSAVAGMLPKNKLGRAVLKKLKVYKGDKHPHKAQMPEAIEINC